MTLFDDWHIQSDIIQKSVESQFKAGEKLANQVPSTEEVLQLQS